LEVQIIVYITYGNVLSAAILTQHCTTNATIQRSMLKSDIHHTGIDEVKVVASSYSGVIRVYLLVQSSNPSYYVTACNHNIICQLLLSLTRIYLQSFTPDMFQPHGASHSGFTFGSTLHVKMYCPKNVTIKSCYTLKS
jgi:hypothetical protein